MTKAKVYKGVGQEGSWGVTSHAPRSVEECEGMNPHTPKELPIWELESSWTGLPNIQREIVGVKSHLIEAFIISLESLWNVDVQNGLA
jgi:hypothetical protein